MLVAGLALAPCALAEPSDGAFRDCSVCPEMVVIPAGTFTRGSSAADKRPAELPQQLVRIDTRIAIGRYEVTFDQWDACVRESGCSHVPDDRDWGRGARPVIHVSWEDARQYVQWLSRKTGRDYRLPSETEWEYAARAGTTTRYWWGNSLLPGKAACKGCGTDPNADRPMRVGAFSENPLGLQDMTGNVAQWVADCWAKDHQGALRNGAARELPNCRRYVLRGGSWKNDPGYLRSSSRDHYDAAVRYPAHGFRVARQKGN